MNTDSRVQNYTIKIDMDGPVTSVVNMEKIIRFALEECPDILIIEAIVVKRFGDPHNLNIRRVSLDDEIAE